ncbi:P-loop containing nucleoside triphosphate hydrolase protein [Atractiella rhizophila]|nr:P-loop containing nucleoside triphosphate hydrolase protein [Atractiella rhizophila]
MEGGKEARGMGIEFRDVSFEYPSPAVKKAIQQGRVTYQMPKVLRNISFTILPGELVALVGFNGSGKSSLVNVISRLYDVTSGTILINGSPIGSYSTPALQKRMSILFQTTTPLPLTAKEYIGVGSVEDVHDMEKIREAARKSDALEIIERLPYGFDSLMSRTMGMGEVEEVVEEEGLPGAVMIGSGSQRREAPKLAMVTEEKEKDDERKDAVAKMDGVRKEETGKERRKVAERETDTRKEENTERAEEKKEDEKKKEMGKEADLQEAWKELGNVTLSGGQQQRIALSQAFMRADADLRVFDEPAGNLDPQAEDRFFKQIYEMRGTCTIIFATHRFSLTAKADRILVMERGQLIEQGTHSELMELKGKYHHLYELQAAGFRES